MKSKLLLAVAAPVVIFALLDVLVVQPERAAAEATRLKVASVAGVPRASQEAGDLADIITTLANSPAVGGVTNLSIEMGAPDTPIAVAFDAQYAQIGRFFWNLRTLPVSVEIRSVALAPAKSPMMRAKLVLFAFRRRTPSPPVEASVAPEWGRDPFASQPGPAHGPAIAAVQQPDPVVKSILFSPSRRVALVDGRIVGVGDHVGTFLVTEIEQDSVVLVTPRGVTTRITVQR